MKLWLLKKKRNLQKGVKIHIPKFCWNQKILFLEERQELENHIFTPSLEDVVAKVKEGSYKKVVLEPLMIVAGDHANNDMAGDEEGSWKTTFEEAGYEVTCLVRGLGELEPIQQLFVEHAKAAVDSLAK